MNTELLEELSAVDGHAMDVITALYTIANHTTPGGRWTAETLIGLADELEEYHR